MSEHNNLYNITINDQQEWKINPNDLDLDFVEDTDGQIHILHNQKAYRAEVMETDFPNKQIKLKINGTIYTAKIADKYDQLVKKLGLSATSSLKINTVKAPMPGLVLEVAVKEGQSIVKGDTLLILEAMKMENVIKSMGEGIVKKIHVKKGTAVDKGQLMIDID